MPKKTLFTIACAAACALASYCLGMGAQMGSPRQSSEYGRPAQATRCDLTVPLQIDLSPLNEPQVGLPARFAVSIKSGIDPDLVKRMWLEYEYPERMRQPLASLENLEFPRTARNGRREMQVLVPDKGRYQIRARLMVELINGKTISKTATRWINLGNAAPDGMIDRIAAPDGTGIRVYQGITVRN